MAWNASQLHGAIEIVKNGVKVLIVQNAYKSNYLKKEVVAMFRYLTTACLLLNIGCNTISIKESKEYKDLLKDYEVLRDLLYEERVLFDRDVEEYYQHDSRFDEIEKRMDDLIILVDGLLGENGEKYIALFKSKR